MVSIVIPVYNVEKYLKDCVNSVISQTYADLQIILVDDGSTDSSGNICDAFAEKDERIHVIHKKNGGLSDARNAGTSASKGEFIFYLESDDYLENDALQVLLRTQDQHRADVVVGNYFYTYDDREDIAENKEQVLDKATSIERLMSGEIQTFTWGKLVRAEIAKKHKFPAGLLFEDHFWTHLVFQDSNIIACIPQPLVHYRQRQNSISYTFTEKRLDIIKGWEARISFLQENYPEMLPLYLNRCAHDVVSLSWLMLTRMKHNGRGFKLIQSFIKEYDLLKYCDGSTNSLLRSIQCGRLIYAMNAVWHRIVRT